MRILPNPPRHPGRILEEDYLNRLVPRKTQAELAEWLGISRPRLNDLIHGRRAVTVDTALRLGRSVGPDPEFWLRAQLEWDLHEARSSREQMRSIEGIEPLALDPSSGERPAGSAAARPAPLPPPPHLALQIGREGPEHAPYLEEFLRRRGLWLEAHRFARIQAQLDLLEPTGATPPERPHALAGAARGLFLPPRPLRPANAQPEPATGPVV